MMLADPHSCTAKLLPCCICILGEHVLKNKILFAWGSPSLGADHMNYVMRKGAVAACAAIRWQP